MFADVNFSKFLYVNNLRQNMSIIFDFCASIIK